MQVFLNLLKKQWSITLHDLDLVHENFDVFARDHINTEFIVSSFQLTSITKSKVTNTKDSINLLTESY